MSHQVEFVYFELDAASSGFPDPQRAIATYDPITEQLQELPKLVALRNAGVPVEYMGEHPRTGKRFYRYGSGLFEESFYSNEKKTVNEALKTITSQELMTLYVEAAKGF